MHCRHAVFDVQYAGYYSVAGLNAYLPVPASQSTDTAIVTAPTSSGSAAGADGPRPIPPSWLVHTRCRPARFPAGVQTRRLTSHHPAACAGYGGAGGDADTVH